MIIKDYLYYWNSDKEKTKKIVIRIVGHEQLISMKNRLNLSFKECMKCQQAM